MRESFYPSPLFPKDILSSCSSLYGIHLDREALDRFETFYSLLSTWNNRMNLVSSRELGRFVEYHILDSLKIASCFPINSVDTLLDFGSGAGLPGIPLSIAFPSIHCTLLESISKKCHFLSTVVETLGLVNTVVLHSRAEEIHTSYDNTFDVVITRATVSLNRFLTLSSRFLQPGGSLVSIKGEHVDDELSEVLSKNSHGLFHIDARHPFPIDCVRTGTVVVMTKF